MHCLTKIPRTNFEKKPYNNPAEQLFRGKVPIEKAVSFFYFTNESPYRDLIHLTKYAGEKECGFYLGALYARELMSENFFCDIDLIVPVPLHPKRLRKRGYNQSMWIAKGISEITRLPIEDKLLFRTGPNESQTHKSRYQRWENTRDIFTKGNYSQAEGKHLLLIDDVITTGATLLACTETLSTIKNIKISVLTLAIAE